MTRDVTCPSCGSSSVFSKPEGLKYAIAQGVVFIHTSFMTPPSPAVAYVHGYFENYIAATSIPARSPW